MKKYDETPKFLITSSKIRIFMNIQSGNNLLPGIICVLKRKTRKTQNPNPRFKSFVRSSHDTRGESANISKYFHPHLVKTPERSRVDVEDARRGNGASRGRWVGGKGGGAGEKKKPRVPRIS